MPTWLACCMGILVFLSFTLVPFLHFYLYNKRYYDKLNNSKSPIDAMLNGDCEHCKLKFSECIKNNTCNKED